jgi:hypothetical protein
MEIPGLAKTLIFMGITITLIGVLILFWEKIPFLGKLPGDFSWKRKNWTVYFPFATSLLISIILSLIFFLINKFR